MKGVIKTKSVNDPIGQTDGIRILITRFHPRKKGFKKGVGYDRWLRGLAPPKDLLMAYKAGTITSQQFEAIYLKHLRANIVTDSTETGAALHTVKILLLSSAETVTLLCHEPEDGKTFCHRHVLKRFLESLAEN